LDSFITFEGAFHGRALATLAADLIDIPPRELNGIIKASRGNAPP
jgi:4-aminobutyrate aminotransferase-like enzyme